MITRLLIGIVTISLLASPTINRSAETRAASFVFETQMFGENQVPPVNTVGWGFFRFFFNDSRTEADITLDLKGLAAGVVTSADIHRGAPGVNGPVVKHLSDGGFIVASVRVSFSRAELEEMAAGNWYISLKTTNHPQGELRGQILPPAGFLPVPPSQPAPQATTPDLQPPSQGPSAPSQAPPQTVPGQQPSIAVRPPNTGDGGLSR